MIETIAQWVIALISTRAVWCTQTAKFKYQRFSPILGLMAQPAWYYSSYQHKQWGVFVVSLVLTGLYFNGLRNFWFRKMSNIE